jgi:hypothetical protein
MERVLAKILEEIVVNDINYNIRYNLIIKAMFIVHELGIKDPVYKVGFRCDDWPVVILHLPQGQISWHMQPDTIDYDGHSTEEKNDRICAFIKANS